MSGHRPRLLRRLRDESALRCAICLFRITGLAKPAVTIINGTARCDDHLGWPS